MYKNCIAAICAAGFLFGCGGGDNSSDIKEAKVEEVGQAGKYPSAAPSKGDYFVYSVVHTSIINGAATQAVSLQMTSTVLDLNLDGSYVRQDAFSGAALLPPTTTLQVNSAGSVKSFKNSDQDCAYSDFYQKTPQAGTPKDVSFKSQTNNTCTTQVPQPNPVFSSVTESQNFEVDGKTEGVFVITVPAGTFTTFKYTAVTSKVGKGGTYKDTETCWTDIKTGRDVACDVRSSGPAGNEFLVANFRLLGFSTEKDGVVGNVSGRYSGTWNFSTSNPSYSCQGFTVLGDGDISGTCNLGSTVDSKFVGKVQSNDGSLTITFPDGTVFTGTLDSPSRGSGKFTGGVSGTWTATRT